MSEDTERLLRRLARERAARKEAEALLEARSLDLFRANEQLRRHSDELESTIAERTAELERTLRQAEAAVAAKADFLATMSHEIRTPLNGILGMSEVLALDLTDPRQLHQIGLLRKSGQTLLALVNDLLDFSKIESGHLELEQRDFNLAGELESTIATHLPAAGHKGLALHQHFRGLPARVRGDSLRLRQILNNLLSNAIKFTGCGSVRVEADAEPSPAGGMLLTLRVIDSGPGISEAAIGRLFEPFSQADSSTTRKFGGTGLGLAIVRRLARAMGGDVGVRSTVGEGSVFRCELPFGDAVRMDRTAPVRLKSCGHEMMPMEILLVEDNAINQTVAIQFMRKLGHEADVASSGREALEMVWHKPYDVIFMDMQMPEMDGLEATRRIRSMVLPKRPRIIALTANVSLADQEKCLVSGMDGFLGKPMRLEDIRAHLCDVCLAHHQAVPPAPAASES